MFARRLKRPRDRHGEDGERESADREREPGARHLDLGSSLSHGPPGERASRNAEEEESYFFGLYLNFWPPIEASYMRPPLAIVKTATPCLYLA